MELIFCSSVVKVSVLDKLKTHWRIRITVDFIIEQTPYWMLAVGIHSEMKSYRWNVEYFSWNPVLIRNKVIELKTNLWYASFPDSVNEQVVLYWNYLEWKYESFDCSKYNLLRLKYEISMKFTVASGSRKSMTSLMIVNDEENTKIVLFYCTN